MRSLGIEKREKWSAKAALGDAHAVKVHQDLGSLLSSEGTETVCG